MPKTSKIGESEVQMDRRFKARRTANTVTEDTVTEDTVTEDTVTEKTVTEKTVTETAVAIPEEASPRRKKQRRRQIDPTTCEREYSDDEVLFMHALDAYKRSSGRMFPTCSEILEVVRGLGYTKLTQEEQALLEIHGIRGESPCEASVAEMDEVN